MKLKTCLALALAALLHSTLHAENLISNVDDSNWGLVNSNWNRNGTPFQAFSWLLTVNSGTQVVLSSISNYIGYSSGSWSAPTLTLTLRDNSNTLVGTSNAITLTTPGDGLYDNYASLADAAPYLVTFSLASVNLGPGTYTVGVNVDNGAQINYLLNPSTSTAALSMQQSPYSEPGDYTPTATVAGNAVPEPGSVTLICLGAALLVWSVARRRRILPAPAELSGPNR